MQIQTDSLVNFVSGLGTSRDKAAADQFYLRNLDKGQIDAAFRGDWVARKTVILPASDATSEWRTWQADEAQLDALEKAERTMRVRSAVKAALVRARLYGGALIVMGVDDGKPSDIPLDVETVQQGQLKFLSVLNRHEVGTGALCINPLSPLFGQPEYYSISTDRGMIKIHPSRCVRFIGNEVCDISLAPDGWGDSVLMAVYDAVMNVGRSTAGIASLIHEAKVDVVKVPDLMQQIATEKYEQLLLRRFSLASTAKSMVNTLILDKDEDYDSKQVSFAQLPEILQQYIQIAAGASDIPATRFVGMAPAGLNATGESDLRNYAIRLRNDQENDIGPAIERLDEVLIRSALGVRPEEIHYTWRPLFTLTEQQRADVDLKRAQTWQIDVNSGLFSEDTLFEARKSQIIDGGVYPGFEAIAKQSELDMPLPEQIPANAQ